MLVKDVCKLSIANVIDMFPVAAPAVHSELAAA